MSDSTGPYRIFLSAAEASGDFVCARLITALKQTRRNFEFVGFGGERMAAAGCNIIVNTTKNAAMTYKAFGQVFFFLKALQAAKKYFAEKKPCLVIVCDSPSFNFHVARAAAKSGIKTFFYIAPQLWAWAPWRLKKLKKLCTAGMAAILPFEPDWFGTRKLECTFVGSPMLEDIRSDHIKPKNYNRYSISAAHIVLVPGSRPAEIKVLWPAMQDISRRLKARHPAIKLTAVAADETILQLLKQDEWKNLRLSFAVDAVYQTALRADFALVTSGSATLQVAAAACPMIIMYQSNKFLWHLVGKKLVTTKYLSLVNILAQKELVPEYMPYFSSINPIVSECDRLLNAPDKLSHLSSELARLMLPLSGSSASQQTAQIITEFLR